nr:extracellular solute-binding protein [Maliibacterium massiliense]
MKKTTRILVLALALCMLLLTGCKKEASSAGASVQLDPKDPVSIEVWHYYNGPQKNAFDKLVAQFNETVGMEQGIIVEGYSQGNVSELIEKVLNAANKRVGAGDIPDIFAAYADTAYQVDKLGLVAELDPYLSQEELDSYVAGYLEEGRFDQGGTLKIFPVAKSSELLMLNRTDWDKFAQATGAKLEDLATFEGVTKTAEAYYTWTDGLTEAPEDGKAFFGRDAMANYFILGCKQLGVDIFNVKQDGVSFELDEQILRRLWDNFYVPYINGYFTAKGHFRSDDAKTGDLIALVGSTSGAAYFPDKVSISDTESYPIETTVLPAPIFADGEKVAVQQGAGMVVSKSDTKTEYAATVFLKWFTQPERNIEFTVGSGYLPVTRAANDMDVISQALAGQGETNISGNLREALPVAIEMVDSHQMYTSRAFDGGTAARDVLENSMLDLAKADREKVEQDIAAGMTRAQAVSAFDTDEHFQQWLAGLKTDLEATAQ